MGFPVQSRIGDPAIAIIEWGGVEDAALRPQPTEPAGEVCAAAAAEIAVVDFAVIAARFDDRGRPGRIEGGARRQRGEEKFHIWVIAVAHSVEVGSGDAKFFGVDQRKHRPAHGIEQLLVAFSQKRRQGLFRNLLRQDDEIFGMRRFSDHRFGELRSVRRHGIALAREEGVFGLRALILDDGFQRQLVVAEIGAHAGQKRRIGGEANVFSGQRVGIAMFDFLATRKALAVIKQDGAETQVARDFAARGPGQAAQDEIDLVVFGEIDEGVDRLETDVTGLAEDAGRYGFADVDVEAAPIVLRIALREAGDVGADAAGDEAFLFDRVKSLPGVRARDREHADGQRCKRSGKLKAWRKRSLLARVEAEPWR
jgi:hypothetical protein